jgi:DNA-binding transcriptional regulator YiaG
MDRRKKRLTKDDMTRENVAMITKSEMSSQDLKALMAKYKLTTSALSFALGVCQQTVIAWRTGRRRIPYIAQVAIRALEQVGYWEKLNANRF